MDSDSGLTPKAIAELLQRSRIRAQNRNSYRRQLEHFLGHPLTDSELIEYKIYTVAQLRRMKPRHERINAILVRRYNVPQSLLEALDNEHRSMYSDW